LLVDTGEESWEEAMTLNFTRQHQITHALQIIERRRAASSTSRANQNPISATPRFPPRLRSMPG
jgi:hypothetical protein